MEIETDINSLRDEAFRKIGRNVFNFQKIEHLLKVLITSTQIFGTTDSIENNLIERRNEIFRKPLGLLAGDFFSNTVKSNSDVNEKQYQDVKEPKFLISMRLENEFHQDKRNEIKLLINERNVLIHQRLSSFNPCIIQDCQDLITYLDDQRERQLIAYDFLESIASKLMEFMNGLNQLSTNEEFLNEISLHFLAQSPVIQLLIRYAQEQQKNNDWADLSAAGNKIRQELPGDLEKIKNGWGFKKLPDLIRAFDFFELKQEPLTNDDYRWLYRIIHQESSASLATDAPPYVGTSYIN